MAWLAISARLMNPKSGRPIRLAEVTFPRSLATEKPTSSAILAVMQSYTPGVIIISSPLSSSLSLVVFFIDTSV